MNGEYKMKLLATLIAQITLLSSILIYSNTNKIDEHCTLIDPVERRISVFNKTGMDEVTFNLVIDHFTKVYEPIVKESGYTLKVHRLWNDDTVNANTTVSGKYWIVNAFGGLARHEMMDAETYLAVMLHEIGHHLGGYPKKSWATNEGGADYYATLKGFRLMIQSGAISNIYDAPVPPSVSKMCAVQHKSAQEIAICKKSSFIGYKLARVLNNLSNSSANISFDTPDKKEVLETYNGHPKAQCRLDTYFAGSVCGKSHKDELSADSPCQGACAEECNDITGVRSRCWYRPKKLFLL
jgi:hypothetical protein